MEKPILSPDFTIEDIHRLREYNYEMTKNMTEQERLDYYTEAGHAFQKEIKMGRMGNI